MLNKKLRLPIYFVFFLLISVFCFSWMSYSVGPVEISKYLLAQVGSGVGMSVSVPENPFNVWDQQLREKEEELEEREDLVYQVLEKRERESNLIFILILGLIAILLILLLVNFYFDYQDRKYQKI